MNTAPLETRTLKERQRDNVSTKMLELLAKLMKIKQEMQKMLKASHLNYKLQSRK